MDVGVTRQLGKGTGEPDSMQVVERRAAVICLHRKIGWHLLFLHGKGLRWWKHKSIADQAGGRQVIEGTSHGPLVRMVVFWNALVGEGALYVGSA